MYSVLLTFSISANGNVWPHNTRWNMKQLTGLRLPELRTIVSDLIAHPSASQAEYHLDNTKTGMHLAISVDTAGSDEKHIYVSLTAAQS